VATRAGGGDAAAGPSFMTVIDTPGHAAFAGMRASGASATDIIVCVIAAESGLEPQTLEVLKLARATNCAVIAAVTKMDLLQESGERKRALQRINNQLLEHGWGTEEYGGDTPLVVVSGKTGEGLEDLKEMVGLQADVLDLRAADSGAAEGVVLESSTEKGHGVVVDALVSWGRLAVGDHVVVGKEYGKVQPQLGRG
jgi:translation initiation factor IF-2